MISVYSDLKLLQSPNLNKTPLTNPLSSSYDFITTESRSFGRESPDPNLILCIRIQSFDSHVEHRGIHCDRVHYNAGVSGLSSEVHVITFEDAVSMSLW